MSPVKVETILPSDILKEDVECIRIFTYTGTESFSIKISPLAVPGIVFQEKNGQSAIASLSTPLGFNDKLPTAFVYGPGIEPSVMNYKSGPYTTIQVILKPHALRTLFGIDASTMTNNMKELNAFADDDLTTKLIKAKSEKARVDLLIDFLTDKLHTTKMRDTLIEACLDFIHKHVRSVAKKDLLDQFAISERQLERRFTQTVGISPQSYIRVKRFNEAIRLMKTKKYDKLTDVAHALNFYDQSHFIRDLKEFSGITPKSIFQKVEDFHDQGGFAYI